ncbi:IclR family transcriptional regulator [Cupriavidus oxalaticus]|uniref:IclR family transcriptional regulator n=1 Tax=Cupriavidus oxalaticus TaxID=96344 RepID=A0A5P3VBG4_9BURK|nr:IclR family transcriptional regulator [Cupriavidus oxalaticus]QEZ43155.1 IclR family transcriptional regulator [Cupriavidus oxalaticus]
MTAAKKTIAEPSAVSADDPPPTAAGNGGGRRRIQSADKATEVLLALVEAGKATPLRDLARAIGMPNSLAHRYLASLMASGLAVQDEVTGLYDLGPTAVRIGASALARVDHLRLASEAMPQLVASTGLPALLCVLGDRGPTIVRWERSYVPFITTLSVGSTFQLTNSATGRVLLAFTPDQVRDDLIELAVSKNHEQPPVKLLERISTIRRVGYDEAESVLIPGLSAMSAPILDVQNEAVACLTLIGASPDVRRIKTKAIKALVEASVSISRSCGSSLSFASSLADPTT